MTWGNSISICIWLVIDIRARYFTLSVSQKDIELCKETIKFDEIWMEVSNLHRKFISSEIEEVWDSYLPLVLSLR